jgi:hypothetical protein
MNAKIQFITALREEFDRWEMFLAGLSEGQTMAPQFPSNWSIKDVIAHLRAWQQVSSARLEAALTNTQPAFPQWLDGLPPESEENREQYNARIQHEYQEQSWSSVHQLWKEGFLRFLELAQAMPEKDLLETGRYSWLKAYPLSAVLHGSLNHHKEHFESFARPSRDEN